MNMMECAGMGGLQPELATYHIHAPATTFACSIALVTTEHAQEPARAHTREQVGSGGHDAVLFGVHEQRVA